jgi:hypothetical protein
MWMDPVSGDLVCIADEDQDSKELQNVGNTAYIFTTS